MAAGYEWKCSEHRGVGVLNTGNSVQNTTEKWSKSVLNTGENGVLNVIIFTNFDVLNTLSL